MRTLASNFLIATFVFFAGIPLAVACSCGDYNCGSTIFVGETIPENIQAVGFQPDSLEPYFTSETASFPEVEAILSKRVDNAWQPVSSKVMDHAVLPMEPWVEGDEYRLELTQRHAGFDCPVQSVEFEIGPPTEIETVAISTVFAEARSDLSHYSKGGACNVVASSVVLDVDFDIPVAASELAALVQIEQEVDGEPYIHMETLCAYDPPRVSPAGSHRVAIACPEATEFNTEQGESPPPGTHELTYVGKIAGADIDVEIEGKTHDFVCPEGEDSAGPDTDVDDSMADPGCTAAPGATSLIALVLIVFACRRRRA